MKVKHARAKDLMVNERGRCFFHLKCCINVKKFCKKWEECEHGSDRTVVMGFELQFLRFVQITLRGKFRQWKKHDSTKVTKLRSNFEAVETVIANQSTKREKENYLWRIVVSLYSESLFQRMVVLEPSHIGLGYTKDLALNFATIDAN